MGNEKFRWDVIVFGDRVASFHRQADADRRLTVEVRAWRKSKSSHTAVLMPQVYDWKRREYLLKERGTKIGEAYIWDTKPLPPPDFSVEGMYR